MIMAKIECDRCGEAAAESEVACGGLGEDICRDCAEAEATIRADLAAERDAINAMEAARQEKEHGE